MKKKKCKHHKLKIYKNLKVFHVTEVSIHYDDDEQYHEATIEGNWWNEWNIKDYVDIEIQCAECEKEWTGETHKDFPKWLQQVLDQEEYHFKEL